jgi:hypothetical protein
VPDGSSRSPIDALLSAGLAEREIAAKTDAMLERIGRFVHDLVDVDGTQVATESISDSRTRAGSPVELLPMPGAVFAVVDD